MTVMTDLMMRELNAAMARRLYELRITFVTDGEFLAEIEAMAPGDERARSMADEACRKWREAEAEYG